MSVKFLTGISIVPCKSLFLLRLKDKNSLPQCQELDNFIVENQIQDISFDYETGLHDTIGLIINHRYYSLDELKNIISNASSCATRYFYLAVNKFYVYATTDSINSDTSIDYDIKLINYCHNTIADKFNLIKYHAEPNDFGTLGNFVHPVTTMFFKRYE